MRYHFIAQHKKAYPVTLMCTVLEVSTTGYYDWATSPTRPRAASHLLFVQPQEIPKHAGSGKRVRGMEDVDLLHQAKVPL